MTPEVEHTAGVFMENKHLLQEISALRKSLEMARDTFVVRDEFERGRKQGLTDAYDECAKLREALEMAQRAMTFGTWTEDSRKFFNETLAKIDEVLK